MRNGTGCSKSAADVAGENAGTVNKSKLKSACAYVKSVTMGEHAMTAVSWGTCDCNDVILQWLAVSFVMCREL